MCTSIIIVWSCCNSIVALSVAFWSNKSSSDVLFAPFSFYSATALLLEKTGKNFLLLLLYIRLHTMPADAVVFFSPATCLLCFISAGIQSKKVAP